MPWKIVSAGGEFCVHKVNPDGSVGVTKHCYPDKASATKYLQALYANAGPEAKKDLLTDWGDVDERQLDPAAANYKPLGADAECGCANCNWFVSPNSCVDVFGDVAPNGVCDLWLAQPEPAQPMMAGKSWFERLIEKVKATLQPAPAAKGPVQPDEPAMSVINFVKQADGRYRFFMSNTNYFKDRQGEIIEDAAHQEFVDWVTKTGNYPELWLWHAGKESKWGIADWVDYTSGFVAFSGLVDAGKEAIAESLQGQQVAVSHGFLGLISKDKIIKRYRTFEISPLPRWAAANIWTDFTVEEVNMPFSKEKREWLVKNAGVTEERVAEWEQSLDGLSTTLKSLGLEWKETAAPDMSSELVAVTTAVKDLGTMLEKIKTAQAELATAQAALAAAQAEQTKTFEERVATVFTAKLAALPQGFEASHAKETLVDQPRAADTFWFGQIVNDLETKET